MVPEKKTAALLAKYPEEEAKLRVTIAKHVTGHKVPYKALSGGIEFVDSVPKASSPAVSPVKTRRSSSPRGLGRLPLLKLSLPKYPSPRCITTPFPPLLPIP